MQYDREIWPILQEKKKSGFMIQLCQENRYGYMQFKVGECA